MTDALATQTALREGEARLRAAEFRAALIELTDITRDIEDPGDLAYAAASIVGRTLKVSRVGYATIDPDKETLHVDRDWNGPGVESLAGVLQLRDYGSFIDSLKRDEFISIPDVRQDERTAFAAEALESRSARSFVNMPVVEQGRLGAVLYVNHAEARDWSVEELDFIKQVGERTRMAVERLRADIALRESEKRYRTLFENIDTGFCVIEVLFDEAGRPHDYRFIEVNPAFVAQTDLTDAVGRTMRDYAPDMEQSWFDMYGDIVMTGAPRRFENEAVALGRWYEVDAFRVGEPEQRRVAVLFHDVSKRKRVEAQIRELNETLEARVAQRVAERDQLWSLSQDMLARADYTGMMSAVSPAWTQVLGWSEAELLSRGYATFMHPDDEGPTLAALAQMGETALPTRFQNRISTSDGGWKWIEWTVAPEADGANFIAVGRDLSLAKAREAELEAAQSALRQSQKMEAMGQLTGGVAHDFNNLLTPIIGSLDMLQRRGLGGPRELRLIEGALQSAERAKTLVQRLLAFARRQPLQPTAVDVRALVQGMADLVISTSGPQIRVNVQLAPGLRAAMADPNQLEMAILNLAVNARDAMPSGGALSIAAEEADAASLPPGLAPGGYIRLSLADTGVGMNEAVLRRATEPFFSTKGIGKGTGLGLSMVHGLASQLGGAMTIASKPGFGTKVELWLPVSPEAAEVTVRAPDTAGAATTGVVLLVDDDDAVRSTTADMLIELGYSVVEAASAADAVVMVSDGVAFDVLVSDHLMPGMTGTDLAREVLGLSPDRPVLIISGFAESEGVAPDLPRLTKPFRQAELAQALAEITPKR